MQRVLFAFALIFVPGNTGLSVTRTAQDLNDNVFMPVKKMFSATNSTLSSPVEKELAMAINRTSTAAKFIAEA